MPVSPVLAPTETAAPPPSSSSTPAPAAGFASALTAATAGTATTAGTGTTAGTATTTRTDATLQPTVTLGRMVEALAAAPGAVAAPPAGAGGASIGGVAGLASASSPAGAAGSRILAAGERYLGVPYRWGGTDAATGFDCSGFVQQVFADLGVTLPRVSVDQAKAGTRVDSLAEAKPGDLVFWNADGKRPNHIGIYAGDGQMLVAPRTGDVVRYQELSRTPHEIRRVM